MDRSRVEQAIAEHQRLVATVHERVACPRCGAPVGLRCRALPRGYRPLDVPGRVRTLETPHKQRLRADGIFER